MASKPKFVNPVAKLPPGAKASKAPDSASADAASAAEEGRATPQEPPRAPGAVDRSPPSDRMLDINRRFPGLEKKGGRTRRRRKTQRKRARKTRHRR